MTSPTPRIEGFRIGTEENPLVHPVTGERLVFHRRAADTDGEVLEFVLRMAPGGFIATPHVHPHAEERFEIGGAPVMIQVGRTKRLYHPGEVAVVSAGVPHNWWNPSDAESATLIQLRPALDMETLFETMFGLAADGKVNKRGAESIPDARPRPCVSARSDSATAAQLDRWPAVGPARPRRPQNGVSRAVRPL